MCCDGVRVISKGAPREAVRQGRYWDSAVGSDEQQWEGEEVRRSLLGLKLNMNLAPQQGALHPRQYRNNDGTGKAVSYGRHMHGVEPTLRRPCIHTRRHTLSFSRSLSLSLSLSLALLFHRL